MPAKPPRVQAAHVSLQLHGKDEGVELVVADEGSGIDPRVLETLFQFGISTKGEKGNGMGLWTVKHILTRHGGDIHVTSTLGEGTQFTVWWPRVFAAARRPEMAAAQ